MRPDLDNALHTACRHHGLDATDAQLIHHYSNAVVYLPAVDAIARINTGGESAERLQTTQAITTWLVDQHDYAATAPLPGATLVQTDDSTVVTFWSYYPQPSGDSSTELTSAHLGKLLRALHQLPPPPVPAPDWQPLESLRQVLAGPAGRRALPPADLSWLQHRIDTIETELSELDWPLGQGLIHGDAWAGNLLWDKGAPRRAILCDWDRVSSGPREVDLIPTWHAAWRYGRDDAWIRDFVDQYGYDLRQWAGFRVLLAMRDLAQLPGPIRRASSPPHAAALQQRLTAIRAGHHPGTWTAL